MNHVKFIVIVAVLNGCYQGEGCVIGVGLLRRGMRELEFIDFDDG